MSEPHADVKARCFVAEFGLGEVVYLRVRNERLRGMILSVTFLPSGTYYRVSWANGTEGSHYPMELTREWEAEFP